MPDHWLVPRNVFQADRVQLLGQDERRDGYLEVYDHKECTYDQAKVHGWAASRTQEWC